MCGIGVLVGKTLLVRNAKVVGSKACTRGVVAEQIRAPNFTSGVSNQQSVG